MAYERHFIPLINEKTGYEFNGKKPAGRCIIESGTTGKVTVNAQNLRPLVRYEVYLLFPDAARIAGVAVGPLDADTKGKAELRREVTPGQLHGLALGNALGAAVLVAGLSPPECPLCGYRDTPIEWRGRFYIHTGKKAVAPEPAVPEHVPESAPMPEPAPERVCEAEPPLPEREFEPVPEPVPVPLPGVAPGPICEPQPEPLPAEPPAPSCITEAPTAPPTLPFITEASFAALPPIAPFSGGDSAGMRWVRATTADITGLADSPPTVLNTPFVTDSQEIYDHFIIGTALCNEDKSPLFYLGIPGEYSETAHTEATRLGFSDFKCYEDTPPADGVFGYWLTAVV